MQLQGAVNHAIEVDGLLLRRGWPGEFQEILDDACGAARLAMLLFALLGAAGEWWLGSWLYEPGVGLAAIAARATEVTDRMFLVAATTLAGLVSADRLEQGALYPQIADLREISRTVAVAVAREALDSGVSLLAPGADVEAAVDAARWVPSYRELTHPVTAGSHNPSHHQAHQP